jgi:uncharacterized protein (TIGR02001 family)
MQRAVCCALLLAATSAGATGTGTTATVGVASNYVWRGETRTADAPAVFGGIDFVAPGGVYAGLHTFNIDDDADKGYEIDIYGGYRFAAGPLDWDIGARRYEFPGGNEVDPVTGREVAGTDDDRDFTEITLGAARDGLGLRLWWSDDYFGSGESARYAEVDYWHDAGGELRLRLHYGMKFSDAIPDHAGRVSDFGFGLERGPFRLAFTNLDDNEDGRQSDNARIALSWRHRLSI